jgi:hypothetical protein
LDTNVPVDELGAGDGLAANAGRTDAPMATPATPPTSIDAAMAAPVIAVRTLFMTADFLLVFLARALSPRLASDAQRPV